MRNKHSMTLAAVAAMVGTIVGLVAGMVMSANAAAGEADFMTPIVVEPAKSATLPELMTKLRSERLIYVGETHTAYADHLLQLEVLRGMAARPEGLAVGVEWF
ncbi:MAG: ChaN family lipoprotein, partial [Sedimenticolaceae bacterium]